MNEKILFLLIPVITAASIGISLLLSTPIISYAAIVVGIISLFLVGVIYIQ